MSVSHDVMSKKLIIEEIINFKNKPSDDELLFGRTFTDRMLLREYKDGRWKVGKLKKFENFSLSPATSVFHYAQEIFEGLKAFRQTKGDVVMFRPNENAKRFNDSAKRMVMPQLEEGYFVQTLNALIHMERDWVPRKRGTALYIRPTMIATEVSLDTQPSRQYYYYIILSPSGPYFSEGFKPTKIKVEVDYVRASIGGTGEVKFGGNYAASQYATVKAKEEGYSQVLWLDAKKGEIIEEVGAMNIAFVIEDEIYTPKLSGSILPGITRKSVIQLADDLGIKCRETTIRIDSLINAIKSGRCTEVFGIGTAASIAPVGELKYKEDVFIINENKLGPITQRLYDQLLGIQYGDIEDRHGWIYQVGTS